MSLAVTRGVKYALCGLLGCKNRACSISWLEVIEGVPNQGVDLYRACITWGLTYFSGSQGGQNVRIIHYYMAVVLRGA